MDRLTLPAAAAAAASGLLSRQAAGITDDVDSLSAVLLTLQAGWLPLALRPDIVTELVLRQQAAAAGVEQALIRRTTTCTGDTESERSPVTPVSSAETDPAPLDLRWSAGAPSSPPSAPAASSPTSSPHTATTSSAPAAVATTATTAVTAELTTTSALSAALPSPLSVASCDGPVRFQRVPNQHFRSPSAAHPSANRAQKRPVLDAAFPCKTCGARFPSYYFVHKHRKRQHTEEAAAEDATSSE